MYHRDEGDFKSLSEVLIEEGMAAPEKILQPQDEAGNVLHELSRFTSFVQIKERIQLDLSNVALFSDSGQISKFDLTLLQRQWSITEPNTEEKGPEAPGGTPFLT